MFVLQLWKLLQIDTNFQNMNFKIRFILVYFLINIQTFMQLNTK